SQGPGDQSRRLALESLAEHEFVAVWILYGKPVSAGSALYDAGRQSFASELLVHLPQIIDLKEQPRLALHSPFFVRQLLAVKTELNRATVHLHEIFCLLDDFESELLYIKTLRHFHVLHGKRDYTQTLSKLRFHQFNPS